MINANLSPKNERIDLRIPAAEKVLLEKAASYQHVGLTTFVMQAALPKARRIVDQAERLVLSVDEAQQVMDYLDHPPAPTAALMAAARRLARRGQE